MNKKRVALHNLGCKVNSYETEAAAQELKKRNYEIVSFESEADIYIINTCSVTNIADRKSRQMIHRARRRNPDAIVVAMGCYVEARKRAGKGDEDADIIIGNDHKSQIADIIDEYEKNRQRLNVVGDISAAEDYDNLFVAKTQDHIRGFMKVQDGCNMFCSYCIIPYLRGRIRSRSLRDAVSEAEQLAKNGCREIVLSGIHLSSYGRDFSDGTSLLTLIRAIHDVDGIERIRLGSLEPGIITEEFVSELASLPKLCPHFHLSLQSGCDKILKAMNRKYDTATYKSKCEILRKYFSEPSLTTDIITGFPGETDEDFEETYRFVDGIEFFETHVFPYSAREGTPAAKMDGQLTEAVKKQRASRLIDLSDKKRRKHLERLIGSSVTVLAEEPQEIDGKTYYTGHTERYEKIAVVSGKDISGKLVKVDISGMINNNCAKGEVGITCIPV